VLQNVVTTELLMIGIRIVNTAVGVNVTPRERDQFQTQSESERLRVI